MLRNFFSKSRRLLRSRDFRLCTRYGEDRLGPFLHLQMRKVACSESKLGLTVSKRFGKATERNRFKRHVREAFRLSQHELPKNVHINARPRREAKQASFQEIQKEFLDLIHK